jgi:hypothetical protein
MSLFEYISVAFSVVLSLSAAQLLSNIRTVFDPARRDLVHGLWVIHLLILHVVVWWSGWAFRDASWNLGSFSLVLSAPALLYVASNALLPSSPTESLRDHFLSHRTLFFAARGLLTFSAIGSSYVLLGMPLLVPERLVAMLILSICVAGLVSANRRVQVVIAIVGLSLEILVVGYLRFDAGSWVGPQ